MTDIQKIQAAILELTILMASDCLHVGFKSWKDQAEFAPVSVSGIPLAVGLKRSLIYEKLLINLSEMPWVIVNHGRIV